MSEAENCQQHPDNKTAPLLRSAVTVLFRRKRVLLATFLAVFGGIALATLWMPRSYKAEMKVLVKNERADLIVSPDANSGSSNYRGDVNENQINSEIELLSSSDLLQQVVRQCRLYEEDPATANGPGDPSPVALERGVSQLRRNLKVTPVRKSDIIQISYTSASPERSADVLKKLASAYLEAHLKLHRAPGAQEFFREQTGRYQTELRDAEARLSELRRSKNLVLINEQKELALRSSVDSQKAVQEAKASLDDSEARISVLREQLQSISPRIATQSRSIPNQYSAERLNTMLVELQNRRTQLLMKFRADDRTVKEVDEEITNTRLALDRVGKMISVEQATDVNPMRQSLEGELHRAEMSRAGMSARYANLGRAARSYQARLDELESVTNQYGELQRAVKQSEDNYLLYVKKQEEARIADSLDQQKISNVAIAETPATPHIPYKPNVTLNLALGLVLAISIGIGAVFAVESASSALHTPAEVEAATGWPVLGAIPQEGV